MQILLIFLDLANPTLFEGKKFVANIKRTLLVQTSDVLILDLTTKTIFLTLSCQNFGSAQKWDLGKIKTA